MSTYPRDLARSTHSWITLRSPSAVEQWYIQQCGAWALGLKIQVRVLLTNEYALCFGLTGHITGGSRVMVPSGFGVRLMGAASGVSVATARSLQPAIPGIGTRHYTAAPGMRIAGAHERTSGGSRNAGAH